MPLFEYRCPNGHIHNRLRKIDERSDPARCLQCDAMTEPIISAPHVPPDGVYSYAPNIGDPNAHDRRNEIIKERNAAKREGRKPKLGDNAV